MKRPMSEKESAPKFDPNLTLESLRQKIQTFAQERDWDQAQYCRCELIYSSTLHETFCLPWWESASLSDSQMGEVGEVCEIMQWKGEMEPGVPELTEEEKVHLGEELSDVLIYLVRLAGKRG